MKDYKGNSYSILSINTFKRNFVPIFRNSRLPKYCPNFFCNKINHIFQNQNLLSCLIKEAIKKKFVNLLDNNMTLY